MPDDFSQDTSTTGVVSIGGTATGVLEVTGDRDWFAVTLSAGQAIEVQLNGVSLSDPFLRVYDASGTLLVFNDDANGLDSQLTYLSTADETVYIEAGAWDDRYVGSYEISVIEVDPPGPLDALDWAGQLSDTSISVYFAPAGYVGADGITSEAWNAYEIARVQDAFATIEAVTNVTFSVVGNAGAADFILQLDANGQMDPGTLGYFYPPGTPNAGLGVFNGAAWDRTNTTGGLERGGEDFVTVVHELLHGMGLAHPHDTGGGSQIMPGVTSAFNSYGDHLLNQGVFTTMSYNSGFRTGPVGTPSFGPGYGHEAGPMALDIALLQEMYGANLTTATGDDVYDLPDANLPGTAYVAIWDASGTDELRYSGTRNATIDLRAATLAYELGGGGFISGANGIAGGYTIADGVVIENATSGSGNDTLTGNDVANLFSSGGGADSVSGGGGDDTVLGNAGADTLRGGEGVDLLDYSASGGAVTVDLGSNTASGNDAAGDDIAGFEQVTGSGFGDVLAGDGGNNTLDGGGGSDHLSGDDGADHLIGGFASDTLLGGNGRDTLDGGYGDDEINGGSGRDTAVYAGFGGGISVNLNTTGAQYTGAAGTDTLTSIEHLVGGDFNDTFIGYHTDGDLFGGGGSDRLYGLGGAETLDGGAGNDILVGGAGNDTLLGGTTGRDVLLGGTGEDSLVGGDDLDQLRGGADSDTLIGGAGRDVLIGGDYVSGGFPGDGAADVFVFTDVSESSAGGGTRDVIRDFEQGLDIIDLSGIDADGTSRGSNEAFTFIGAAAFGNIAGELRAFDINGNTVLRGDVDGDGVADFEVFLNGAFTLTAADFIL